MRWQRGRSPCLAIKLGSAQQQFSSTRPCWCLCQHVYGSNVCMQCHLYASCVQVPLRKQKTIPGACAEGKGYAGPCVACWHENRHPRLSMQPCGKECVGGHLSNQTSLDTIWFDHDVRDLIGGHAGTCMQQEIMSCLSWLLSFTVSHLSFHCCCCRCRRQQACRSRRADRGMSPHLGQTFRASTDLERSAPQQIPDQALSRAMHLQLLAEVLIQITV